MELKNTICFCWLQGFSPEAIKSIPCMHKRNSLTCKFSSEHEAARNIVRRRI